MTLNQFIDHTLLKANATNEQISKLCEEAIQHNFSAVCIPPYYIDLAKKKVDNSEVKVCTVLGFPFGYDHVATKIEGISRALDAGVDELDIVVNLPAVKNGNWDTVQNEIDSFTTLIKRKKSKVMKLILETGYLNLDELENLCNLCIEFNVDFAKTSTGFGPRGASLEDIIQMKTFLDDKVKIKASGGIKTKKDAEALVLAGATRLGTSSGINLI